MADCLGDETIGAGVDGVLDVDAMRRADHHRRLPHVPDAGLCRGRAAAHALVRPRDR